MDASPFEVFTPEGDEEEWGKVAVRYKDTTLEYLTPEQARAFADALHTSAEYAQGVHDAGVLAERDRPKITPADAGTWLDGAMGWHNTYRVIERAQAYGFDPPLDHEANEAITRYREGVASDGEREVVLELSDAATEHLQMLAPEGYTFVWDDGLSLQADDDLDENGSYIGS